MAFINKIDSVTPNALSKQNPKTADAGFEDLLKQELQQTNEMLEKSEKAQADIATGKVEDLAKASITIQKAEMQMKMVLEVRNKAISAYKELLKTQI